MRLPNKVTPYKKSVIAYFPSILSLLKKGDMSLKILYEEIIIEEKDMGDFLSAIDCLFALGKIGLNEERGSLYYVNGD